MTPDEQHQLMVSVGRFQTPPYDKEPLFACVDSMLAAERAAGAEECRRFTEQIRKRNVALEKELAAIRKLGEKRE